MPPETRCCPSHMAADRPGYIKVASSAHFSSDGARVRYQSAGPSPRVRYPTTLSFVDRKGIYTKAIFAKRGLLVACLLCKPSQSVLALVSQRMELGSWSKEPRTCGKRVL